MAPTKIAQEVWQTSPGEDFLQLNNSAKGNVAGVDSDGKPYGGLALGGGGTPGGTNTAIQFNDGGKFGGDATDLSWNKTTKSFQAFGGVNGDMEIAVGSVFGNGIEIQGNNVGNSISLIASETGATIDIEADNGINFEADNGNVSISSDSGIVQVAGGTQACLGSGNTGSGVNVNISSGVVTDITLNVGAGITKVLEVSGDSVTPKLAFFAANPVAKPTVTGSKGGNAALASLITALASLGLITDSTT